MPQSRTEKAAAFIAVLAFYGCAAQSIDTPEAAIAIARKVCAKEVAADEALSWTAMQSDTVWNVEGSNNVGGVSLAIPRDGVLPREEACGYGRFVRIRGDGGVRSQPASEESR